MINNKYYLKRIQKAIYHINKAYSQLNRFYDVNNLENKLNKDEFIFYNVGIYHLTEADEILSRIEIELEIKDKEMENQHE